MTTAIALRPRARQLVDTHDFIDYESSAAWTDYQDECVESRTQSILDDDQRNLSEIIGDYCDSPSGQTICGLAVDHWSDYEKAVRAAIEESPCFRDFMEKAAFFQAQKDFGEMVKE